MLNWQRKAGELDFGRWISAIDHAAVVFWLDFHFSPQILEDQWWMSVRTTRQNENSDSALCDIIYVWLWIDCLQQWTLYNVSCLQPSPGSKPSFPCSMGDIHNPARVWMRINHGNILADDHAHMSIDTSYLSQDLPIHIFFLTPHSGFLSLPPPHSSRSLSPFLPWLLSLCSHKSPPSCAQGLSVPIIAWGGLSGPPPLPSTPLPLLSFSPCWTPAHTLCAHTAPLSLSLYQLGIKPLKQRSSWRVAYHGPCEALPPASLHPASHPHSHSSNLFPTAPATKQIWPQGIGTKTEKRGQKVANRAGKTTRQRRRAEQNAQHCSRHRVVSYKAPQLRD